MKALQLSEEEAKALVRSFRLVVTQNNETRMGRPCESVTAFAEDIRQLERAAKRLSKQLAGK
jgi:hypothetical protein